MENEKVEKIFSQSEEMIAGLIKLLVDETQSGIQFVIRDVLRDLSKKLPFTFLDEFRKASNNKALKRQDIVQEFI
jgi:hypothetical protein